MARRVKPKIQYKKNKKVPEAIFGSVIKYFKARKQKKKGERQRKKGRKAMKEFDMDRLQSRRTVSKATRELADTPIDEGYMQQMQDARLSSEATAMRNIAGDPRAGLAGVLGLQDQARQQELDTLGIKQDAKTKAMENLAREQESVQKDVEERRLKVTDDELAGIKGEIAAGEQNVWAGIEGQYSAAAEGYDKIQDDVKDLGKAILGIPPSSGNGGSVAETSSADNWLENNPDLSYQGAKGGKVGEDGGVTPGEFDHDTNPIDMVQDGEKIGEATGGELILPPDDVEEIRDALQNEDKDAAFELMQELVKKYDSNVISSDKDEAEDGATVPPDAIPKDKAAKIMKYVMRKDYYGSPGAPDYVDIAREELNLTDKETNFLVKYADSRKKSSKKREQKAMDKRSASGQMGGDMSMGGYLKRMVSKLKNNHGWKRFIFTGTILKNNRDLHQEQIARDQLKIQREQLEIQKEKAAFDRAERRKKDAPKYKDFGESNVGGFSPSVKNNIDTYIDWVGDNYENEGTEYFTGKAKLEKQISSDNALLAKIYTDYESKIQDLAKGGQALNQANYVLNTDGAYEFERRYAEAVELVNSGKMTAEEAAQMYYNNEDQSLYKVTEGKSLGAGLVEGYAGEGSGNAELFSKDGKKYYGWSDGAKNAIYETYKDALSHSPEKGFENPQGQRTYFNSRFEGVNAQVLFFREAKGKLTVDEQSNILSQLNPDSEDYDVNLANEYIDFLAKKDSDRFMTDKGFETGRSDNKFKDRVPKFEWDKMINSQSLTEQTYGAHGKMLEEFKISQTPKPLTLTKTMIDTLEASDRDPSIDTNTARQLISQLDAKSKELKLTQVMINESKNNMYGVFEIIIPKTITGKDTPTTIEFSVPLNQLDRRYYGETTETWYDSFSNASIYQSQSQSESGNQGGGAPRPS